MNAYLSFLAPAAEYFPDRSEVQCLHRWQKVLNPDLVKGPWTPEVGTNSLLFCFSYLCHLESGFFSENIFFQEDDKIVKLVTKYGPTKWSVIAKSLPGRIGKQCRER